MNDADHPWLTRVLPDDRDELAPDGSEVRFLARVGAASVVHCTLPAGQTSAAVRHRTVEEVWYVVDGAGELWRRRGDVEETVGVRAGLAITIPRGTEFQFRATGDGPLRFICVTAPPWPGPDEASLVDGRWPTGGSTG